MKNVLLTPASDIMAYFSFVMATGIVSLAAFQQGWREAAFLLFALNRAAYAVLAVFAIIAALRKPSEFAADAVAPERAPGMFTIVAGTCILGSQAVVLWDDFKAGMAFWIAGLLFYVALTYSFFSALIVRTDKSAGELTVSGEWLLYVVGTQALAVLAVLLVPSLGLQREDMLLAAACLHLAGIALYFILIVLVVQRMFFFVLPPERLTPPYWITMGASAISTLAGAELILHATPESFLREALPVMKWMTLLLWSVSTWWIPLLVVLNVWRYIVKRVPVSYDVQHWSMVFPLGMYTACSYQFGEAAGLPVLVDISRYFIYLALAAWTVVCIGMAVSFGRRLLRS